LGSTQDTSLLEELLPDDCCTNADEWEDSTGLVWVVIFWQINDFVTVRILTSFRHRESNKDFIVGYDQFNSGLGA